MDKHFFQPSFITKQPNSKQNEKPFTINKTTNNGNFTSTSTYLLTFFTVLSITSQITQVIAIHPTTTTTYTDFIRTSCKATTYPDLCYNSLSTHASAIQTSPELLANTALSVTLDTARTTSTTMSKMSKGPRMLPKDVGAIRDCMEVLSDTVQQLQNSMKEMSQMRGIKNFRLLMNDVQTWVSAALTNEDTCMQGFGGKKMDGVVKTGVRGQIVTICHLTSNSLALINSLASLHG